MLLKNFDHVMTWMMLASGREVKSGVSYGGEDLTVQSAYGSSQTIRMASQTTSGSTMMGFMPPISLNVDTLCLGDGNTAVTYEDYKLSGTVVPNVLKALSNNVVYDAETNTWKRTLVASYSNTTDAAITINEWGIFKLNEAASSYIDASRYPYNNSANYLFLTFREVLETPIVIEPNTIATLTFTLDVPHEINRP